VYDPETFIDGLANIGEGEVLALNADLVCGKEHLESAVEHALRSFERGTNTANNIMMETMLFASGERQISKAQDKMGVKRDAERIALVLFAAKPDPVLKYLGLRRDDEVLEASKEKALRFGITRNELDEVSEGKEADLVLEKVAFLEVLKR